MWGVCIAQAFAKACVVIGLHCTIFGGANLWGGLVVEFGAKLSWGVRRWTKGNFSAILKSSKGHFPMGRKFLTVEEPIEFGGDFGAAKFD